MIQILRSKLRLRFDHMISLIVARAHNGAIGRDGGIPWHAPEDLAFFQRETRGGAVIMGRRTWESLPVRPLKGRLNIVVSSGETEADHTVRSVREAISVAQSAGYARIYGIGGASIYAEMLPLADRLLITEVDLAVPDADTFFPDPDMNQWAVINTMDIKTTEPACRLSEMLKKA